MSSNFYFWDPLAAAVVTTPDLVNSRTVKPAKAGGTLPASPQALGLRVVQELDEENDCSGQLIRTEGAPLIDVAMWANAEAFYDEFIRTVNIPE